MALAPAHKGCGFGAVHHVVTPAVTDQHVFGQRRHFAVQAGGAGVDDEVEVQSGKIFEARALDVAEGGEQCRQFVSAVGGAVGDDDLRRPLRQQRFQHAARRAAGTDEQHPLSLDAAAVIGADVAHQADAVRVAPHPCAVAVQQYGVDRAGQFRLRTAFGDQRPGLLFERHGDVESLAAGGEEIPYRLFKTAGVNLNGAVGDALPRLLREGGVDARRFGMGNGIAHHRIGIGLGVEVEQGAHAVLILLSATGQRVWRSR